MMEFSSVSEPKEVDLHADQHVDQHAERSSRQEQNRCRVISSLLEATESEFVECLTVLIVSGIDISKELGWDCETTLTFIERLSMTFSAVCQLHGDLIARTECPECK